MKTRPRVPVGFPSMNSSVSRSSTFMYESMLSRSPLYSVWPHFRRTTTWVATLRELAWSQSCGSNQGVPSLKEGSRVDGLKLQRGISIVHNKI